MPPTPTDARSARSDARESDRHLSSRRPGNPASVSDDVAPNSSASRSAGARRRPAARGSVDPGLALGVVRQRALRASRAVGPARRTASSGFTAWLHRGPQAVSGCGDHGRRSRRAAGSSAGRGHSPAARGPGGATCPFPRAERRRDPCAMTVTAPGSLAAETRRPCARSPATGDEAEAERAAVGARLAALVGDVRRCLRKRYVTSFASAPRSSAAGVKLTSNVPSGPSGRGPCATTLPPRCPAAGGSSPPPRELRLPRDPPRERCRSKPEARSSSAPSR